MVVQERFGPYGGRFVPETLISALDELTAAWTEAREDDGFRSELDVLLRDFVGRLLATQGVEAPDKDLPVGVAKAIAAGAEAAWRLLPLKGRPPLTRFAVWVSSLECTIDITRARDELGYEPVRSIDDGLAELREAAAGDDRA